MRWLLVFLGAWLKPKARLIAENLCLRQQLGVYQRQYPHPRLRERERRFWILMSRCFAHWRECLVPMPSPSGSWGRYAKNVSIMGSSLISGICRG